MSFSVPPLTLFLTTMLFTLGYSLPSQKEQCPILYLTLDAISYMPGFRVPRAFRTDIESDLLFTCAIFQCKLVDLAKTKEAITAEEKFLEIVADSKIPITYSFGFPLLDDSTVIFGAIPSDYNDERGLQHPNKIEIEPYLRLHQIQALDVSNGLVWLWKMYPQIVAKMSGVASDQNLNFKKFKTETSSAMLKANPEKFRIYISTNTFFLKECEEDQKPRKFTSFTKKLLSELCETLCDCVIILPMAQQKNQLNFEPFNNFVDKLQVVPLEDYMVNIYSETKYKIDISEREPGSALLLGGTVDVFVQERYSLLLIYETKIDTLLPDLRKIAGAYVENRAPKQNELLQLAVCERRRIRYQKMLPDFVRENTLPVVFLDIDNALLATRQIRESDPLAFYEFELLYIRHACNVRPGVMEFLTKMCNKFVHCVLFTYGYNEYAKIVMNMFNTKLGQPVISEFFGKDDMWFGKKDIGGRGVDTKWCYLVDDAPDYGVYPSQTIQVQQYYYDPNVIEDSTYHDLTNPFMKVYEAIRDGKPAPEVVNYKFRL